MQVNIFDELAASVTGLRGAYSAYSEKDEGVKNTTVSKTIAAACAAALFGSLMGFSGIIAFHVAAPLAFSHFAHQKPPQKTDFSLFDSMADILTLASFHRFSSIQEETLLPESFTDALTLKYLSHTYSKLRTDERPAIVAKTILVALAAGIMGSVAGCFSSSLLLISGAFAFAHYTRLAEKPAIPPAPLPNPPVQIPQ